MKVELLDHMGSDLDICNAARVSFAKESEWETGCICGSARECGADSCSWGAEEWLSNKDTKLIQYLAKHHHWTPFSHCYAKFRIKAPLFVRSQLFKHKVGLTENEVSRRYVDSEPEFYIPTEWRLRAANVKQGSSSEVYTGPIGHPKGHTTPNSVVREAAHIYKRMVDELGICPEQARMILPQSMYTEWIWSGSIAAFARVYQQRTSDHAQHETKQVALQIGELLEPLFPVSWKALCATS